MEPVDPTTLSTRVALARHEGATPKQLRGDGWHHPYHGLVRPAYVGLEQPAQHVADAIGLMTDGCVLGGWASRWLQGGQMCDGVDRNGARRDVLIHCILGARLRRRAGIRPFEGLLLPGEYLVLETVAVSTLARAAFDEMRLALGLREAVVALDMAISTTIEQSRTTLANVVQVVDAHPKVRRIVQCRQALTYASARSASPWETRTRLVAAIDAGIGPWEVNAAIFDLSGNLLGIADLLHTRSGLVLESDGAGHRGETQHNDDNEREERFEYAGLTVARVGALQHADRPRLAARIRAAYAAAQRVARRGWTLDKPDWWWQWPPGRRWD